MLRASPLRTALALVFLSAGCSIETAAPDTWDGGPAQDESVASQDKSLTTAQAALARWSDVIALPLVPASAANLPDGKVLLWSAEDRFNFGPEVGRTYTVLFDPTNNAATERLVSQTNHDMFCPGTANLADGRILVNGGLSSGKTSIYNPATNTWTSAADMVIPRGYQGSTPLWDGSVLTLGGSWRGGMGNKHGERWTEASGWQRLTGVPIDPFLAGETTGFATDSHLWMLAAGNGRVLFAGPSINMSWIDTQGSGRVSAIGRRSDDEFSINGSVAMYDAGRVLKMGGAPSYSGGVRANANSYVIELGESVQVRKVESMAYRRAYHNSVVLPNGQVVVIGGATEPITFSDSNAVLAAELFDPVTETFVTLPPMSVPRNYHSIALLLADGRVLSAGGGLCGDGCAANHPDLQILSPPYLFNADGTLATRPVIRSAPAQANHGAVINVTTNAPVSSFAIVRASSTTHTVNNDQRRLPLTFTTSGANSYAVTIPTNPGWALPGVYMLFAMNAQGVPSLARSLRVGAPNPLRITPVEDQSTTSSAETSLIIEAASPTNSAVTYGATGLPPGLAINPTTGVISGTATSVGRFLVEVSASDRLQTVSTEFTWTVTEPGSTRFVRFEALSEVTDKPWASAAEIDLLDDNGQPMTRGAWTITANSAELPDGRPQNAIDGDPATLWHTQWRATSPRPPHWLTIDLGGSFRVSGLRYLPRPGGGNGTIARYRVYVSSDGVSWGNPVAEGDLRQLGAAADEKTVYFQNAARGKTATQSSTSSSAVAARAIDGNNSGDASRNSVSITNAQGNAYWEVDLGASHKLAAVRLWNRTDCCAEQLANFYVLASDAPMAGRTLSQLLADPNVAGVHVGGPVAATQLITLPVARARYVRVQLRRTGALQLAEVEVHGWPLVNRPPTLVAPAPSSLQVGGSTTLALEASDPDGDPLTYAATGLPPGLTIDASTGVIRGTATTAGNYNVTATVSDGRGGRTSRQFSFRVGAVPPVLGSISAPVVTSGSTVRYTAQATGSGPFEYQWNFGDGSGPVDFTRSPQATHTYRAPGVYSVTLTVRNSDGGAASQRFLQAVAGSVRPGSPKSSSNLALEPRSGASTRLWVVNQDNDSVSVFDTATLTKVSEVSVGRAPRSVAVGPDGRVWVTNKGSHSLSIIDPATRTVRSTIALPRGSAPFGVVVAGNGDVYVVLEGTGRLLRLNSAGATLASANVGPNPRHVALTASGDKLLVSRFVTRFQPGEATGTIRTVVGGRPVGAEVLVVSPSTLAITRTITLQHSDKPDTAVSGRGVPNYLGAPAISPDGLSAWVPSKQDNIARGSLRNRLNLDFQNTVRAISSRIDLSSESEDFSARVDHDDAGLASAAAYHPTGAYLFVALETSRQVAVMDAYGERELFRIEAGLAPQGVQVSADGRSLYVHNFMDRSVGVYNLSPLVDMGQTTLPLVSTLRSVSVERLSAQVLRGKQLFYDARDPRLARDAYLSCASCHNDGGHDGRTWDFTGMGEGLRNTVSLRGRAGAMGRLHWSANFDEGQDFEGQIRSFAQGTGLMSDAQFLTGTRSQPLGAPKAGVSNDLDALAAYLTSLKSFEASPYRTASGQLTADALLGRTVFAAQCASCHGSAAFSDSPSLSSHDVGTLKASSGKRLGGSLTALDTPTLRDAWATAPYLHDGSAESLEAAIQAHTNLKLTATELANVSAFTRQIGSEEPAVAPLSSPVAGAPGVGLVAQYFANERLSGTPAFTRNERVYFAWGGGAPKGLPSDRFSARWSGQLAAPKSGTYRLQTVSDDGVRVWLNGSLLIDNWTQHAATRDASPAVTLVAGQRYDITVEYMEVTGSATMQLQWLPPGASSYVAIPKRRLYPARQP